MVCLFKLAELLHARAPIDAELVQRLLQLADAILLVRNALLHGLGRADERVPRTDGRHVNRVTAAS